MAVISLTSIPPRFAGLPQVIASLRAQTADIDEIQLYIPRRYRRFPDWTFAAPEGLDGVRVTPVGEDLGPATKVLYAAQAMRGTTTPVLFCDDDAVYAPDWAAGLLEAHRARPGMAIAAVGCFVSDVLREKAGRRDRSWARVTHRHNDLRYYRDRFAQALRERSLAAKGQRPARHPVVHAGQAEILMGFAGALILPEFIDPAFYDIPDALWMVDDIWLSGHLARRGIPIWLPKGLALSEGAANKHVAPLLAAQFDGAGREASNRAAVAHFRSTYGIWSGG